MRQHLSEDIKKEKANRLAANFLLYQVKYDQVVPHSVVRRPRMFRWLAISLLVFSAAIAVLIVGFQDSETLANDGTEWRPLLPWLVLFWCILLIGTAVSFAKFWEYASGYPWSQVGAEELKDLADMARGEPEVQAALRAIESRGRKPYKRECQKVRAAASYLETASSLVSKWEEANKDYLDAIRGEEREADSQHPA